MLYISDILIYGIDFMEMLQDVIEIVIIIATIRILKFRKSA